MKVKTQEEQILKALKEQPEGVHPTHFIQRLYIYQYNARINGLRTRFGCECKHGSTQCKANEHIRNERQKDGTTKFFYINDTKERNKVDINKYHQEYLSYRNKKEEQNSQLSLL